ncbi:hypothetical protein WDU94_002141 [Cyamophila willieti]
MTTLGALIETFLDWPLSAAVPTTCSNVDRNKLRFALPSVEVVQAFTNGKLTISERAYKSMEATLFAWPVGQALLVSPAEFARALRLTSDAYEQFTEDTKFLKPLILSRDGVNKVLSRLQPRQTYDKEAAGDARSLGSPGVPWDSGDESPDCESEPDFDPYTGAL